MKTLTWFSLLLLTACGAAPTDECSAARELLTSCGVSLAEFACSASDASEILQLSCAQIQAGQAEGKHDGIVFGMSEGSWCFFNAQCKKGLVCRGGDDKQCGAPGTNERDLCDDGSDCASGVCNAGRCTRHCSPGAVVCERDDVYRCGADGKSVVLETQCKTGRTSCDAQSGQCLCKPGAMTCNTLRDPLRHVVETCNSSGVFVVEETCGPDDYCYSTSGGLPTKPFCARR